MADAALVIGVGAAAGVGAAMCRRAARGGLHVVPMARSEERLRALADAIRASGGAATPAPGDACSAADIARAFDVAARASGAPPKLVVFNAGNARLGSLLEMTDAFFEDTWRTACFAGFVAGREAARRMLPGGGTLIFTGATASLRARPPFTAFASAKAALRALAQGMAREFGPQGLHVAHVVIDGAIDGDQLNTRAPQLKERLGEDGMLSPDAIAEAYWQLHLQPRDAWTHELDLRPFKETF